MDLSYALMRMDSVKRERIDTHYSYNEEVLIVHGKRVPAAEINQQE
jgi:hypothetical protein